MLQKGLRPSCETVTTATYDTTISSKKKLGDMNFDAALQLYSFYHGLNEPSSSESVIWDSS